MNKLNLIKKMLACVFLLSLFATQAQAGNCPTNDPQCKDASPLNSIRAAAVPAGQLGDCSLCLTCGGAWPVYADTIPTASGATERGASCNGNLGSSSDTIPYLCCN